MRAWSLVVLVLACGSGPPPDPSVLSAPIAQNLALTQLGILQVLEVS